MERLFYDQSGFIKVTAAPYTNENFWMASMVSGVCRQALPEDKRPRGRVHKLKGGLDHHVCHPAFLSACTELSPKGGGEVGRAPSQACHSSPANLLASPSPNIPAQP